VQLALQTLAAQGSVQDELVSPGLHSPWPVHVLQLPYAPQPHCEVQVRVRVWVPQLPQPWVWLSVVPGTQVPWLLQVPQLDQALQPHCAVQVRVRVWVPQLPHDWLWLSVCPGVQMPCADWVHWPPAQMPGPHALFR
jgi:hypothetical protein